MSVEKVILVAREEFLRKQVAQHLRKKRIDVAECGEIQEAHDYLGKGNFDLMLLDETLPDGSGTEFLVEVNLRPAKPMVVMMGAEGSVDTAVQCMKDGAFDYLIKPFSNEQVEIILHKVEQYAQVLNVNQFLTQQEAEDPEGEILGQSPATEQMRKLIRRVAQTDATVLIQGESGVGKELVARAIHRNSRRGRERFVQVNCAALPEELIESELFGHERGAFTDAKTARMGLFEAAKGGTLFLDELASLSLGLQAKVLKAIEDKRIRRLGGNREIDVDVRIIAAGNRDLGQAVADGQFRDDLHHRLSLFRLVIPPLRERGQDILKLAEHLLKSLCRRHRVAAKPISADGQARLLGHAWPGNVRELSHELERTIVFEEGDEWTFAALPGPAGTVENETAASGALNPNFDFPQEGFSLDATIHELIQRAIDQAGGNVSAAARLLGVSRDYIRYRQKNGSK